MAKIVVTGCSRGIGYELVRLLLKEGHEVLALSGNTDPLQKLQHEHFYQYHEEVKPLL